MKLLRLALAILLVWFVVPTTAAAHSGVQSYVYVSVFDDGLEGRVEYPIADLSDVIGVELPDDPSTIAGLSDDVRDTIVGYTSDHLAMGDGAAGRDWSLGFDGTIDYLPTESGGYVLVWFDVVDDFDDVPRQWTVTFDGVIEANPERDALFLIEDDWQSATFRNEAEHLVGFSVGNETQVVDLETVSTFESLREIARRGSVAIDRSAIALAAIATLVATAALVSRPSGSSWRSTLTGIGARVGLVVVGQSASLWIIGFAGVDVGVRVAMFAGALAVLIAAASRWVSGAGAHAAALVVGVLVGVVIGGEFVRQELHRSRPVRSLLAFDVGASATVVFAAALLVPLLLIVGRSRFASRVGLAVGALAAVGGAVWLVESSLDVTFPLRTLELHVADAITSPLIVGIATVIVGVAVLTGSTRTPSEPGAPTADDASTPGASERIEVR